MWRQDPDDRSKLVVVNRKDYGLKAMRSRGNDGVYPPEDRIENKLTLTRNHLEQVGVEQNWVVKKRKLLKKMSRRTPHNPLR